MKFLLFLLAFTTSIYAAQSAEKTLRILYLNAPSDAPRELILFDGKDSQTVKLPKMNLSPIYTLRADAQAIALLTSAPESAKNVPVTAPRAKIPKDVLDFYLFISPDPNNPVCPVKMTLVGAGNEDFEIGQMLWFNLTDHTIAGKIGRESLIIKPRSRHLMDAPTSEANNYPVMLAYRMDGDQHTYPICETQWFHSPNSRNVAFVFSRPGIRTPKVMVFPDYRQTWR